VNIDVREIMQYLPHRYPFLLVDRVTEFVPGDLVVPTVRRPGGSFYDQIGQYDMTLEDTYYERGINLLHGYLTELFVDDPEYLVKVPKGLKDVAVLLEPMSIIQKGLIQAYEAQRRLKIWRPQKRRCWVPAQWGCSRPCRSG